jgi:hypothetical protein
VRALTGRTIRRPTDDNNQDGFVLVWMALMLTVLMGMAAFSVDVGHWYLVASREQNAADAAALAAAIHWPGDPVTALAEAQAAAVRNGFKASEITLEPGDGPARVKVTIAQTVDNYFGNFLGIQRTAVSRSATGEYQSRVPLGSPANTFGDEPLQTIPPETRWSNLYGGAGQDDRPQFWTNVFGPQSVKENGDAHQARVCTADAMRCNSPATNLDYVDAGYTYVVRVGTVPSGVNRLAFEVFDPAFVNVGDTCTDANITGGSPLPTTFDVIGANPNRYASGSASPFCTGDQLFTGNGQDGVNPTTTFVVRAPDLTPWDYLDNPVIATTSCNSNKRQFTGYNASLTSLLSANAAEPGSLTTSTGGGGGTVFFKDHFHKWFRICELSTAGLTPGDYVIQVRTNAALGSATNPVPTLNSGSGANRFAMRAGWLTAANTPNSTNVTIFAADAMSLYANAQGADTRFFLARVFPGAAGRILHLSFFDTGDAGQPGDLTVLPPFTAPGEAGGFFSGCTHDRPSSAIVNGPTAANCTIQGLIKTKDNGDWIEVYVPIPANYTCNSADPTGCWVTLRFTYPVGTVVNDTTTWAAELIGDPVRLVK